MRGLIARLEDKNHTHTHTSFHRFTVSPFRHVAVSPFVPNCCSRLDAMRSARPGNHFWALAVSPALSAEDPAAAAGAGRRCDRKGQEGRALRLGTDGAPACPGWGRPPCGIAHRRRSMRGAGRATGPVRATQAHLETALAWPHRPPQSRRASCGCCRARVPHTRGPHTQGKTLWALPPPPPRCAPRALTYLASHAGEGLPAHNESAARGRGELRMRGGGPIWSRHTEAPHDV